MAILGFFFLVGLYYAARAAGEQVGSEYGKSREAKLAQARSKAAPKPLGGAKSRAVRAQHAAGWWSREAGRGFPVTRTGMHAGWLAHRTATAHVQARREEARTTQVETQASFLAGLREHRQRQAEALARIQAELEQQNQGAGGKEAVQKAGAKVLPFRRPAAKEDAPPPDHPADPVSGDPPEAGATTEAARQAASQPSPAGGDPAPEGTTTVAETNYTNVYAYLTQMITGLDQDLAQVDRNISESTRMAEDLQAMKVDGGTLGLAMDLVERWSAERAALVAIQEQAVALRSALEQRHGGIAEAVQNAPVRAAETQFYEE